MSNAGRDFYLEIETAPNVWERVPGERSLTARIDADLVDVTTKEDPAYADYGIITGGTLTSSAVASWAGGAALPAGRYRVSYVDHAWRPWNGDPGGGWAVSADYPGFDPRYGPRIIHSGGTQIACPGVVGRYTTEALAEAASLGAAVEFDHTGGPVQMYLYDTPYADNGGTVPRFRLERITKPPFREAHASGLRSAQVQVSGVVRDDLTKTLTTTIFNAANNGSLIRARVHESAGWYQGSYVVAVSSRSGDHNGAETYDLTLASATAPIPAPFEIPNIASTFPILAQGSPGYPSPGNLYPAVVQVGPFPYGFQIKAGPLDLTSGMIADDVFVINGATGAASYAAGTLLATLPPGGTFALQVRNTVNPYCSAAGLMSVHPIAP